MQPFKLKYKRFTRVTLWKLQMDQDKDDKNFMRRDKETRKKRRVRILFMQH